jgi:hypothetical protein
MTDKVFISKTPDGEVLCDIDPAVLQRAGAENITAMPLEEYRRPGHHEVVIAFEGSTPRVSLAERTRKAVRKREIYARFEELDRLRIRPLAALEIDGPRVRSLAEEGEEEAAVMDREYLEKLNEEAEELREELAAL